MSWTGKELQATEGYGYDVPTGPVLPVPNQPPPQPEQDAQWIAYQMQRAIEGGAFTAPETYRELCAEMVPAVAPLVAEVRFLRLRVALAQAELAEQEAYCSIERLDVPSWVATMRAALSSPREDQ